MISCYEKIKISVNAAGRGRRPDCRMVVMEFLHSVTWTRDGKVRAEQVGITPQVSGSILQLNVTDNQRVKAGEVLFTIDDTPYRIAVLNARRSWRKPGRRWRKRRRSKARPPARLAVAEACRKMPSRLKTLRTSIPP